MVLGAAELTVGATRRDREYLRAQPQDLRICGIQNEHGLRSDLSSELKSGPAHSWQFADGYPEPFTRRFVSEARFSFPVAILLVQSPSCVSTANSQMNPRADFRA